MSIFSPREEKALEKAFISFRWVFVFFSGCIYQSWMNASRGFALSLFLHVWNSKTREAGCLSVGVPWVFGLETVREWKEGWLV